MISNSVMAGAMWTSCCIAAQLILNRSCFSCKQVTPEICIVNLFFCFHTSGSDTRKIVQEARFEVVQEARFEVV